MSPTPHQPLAQAETELTEHDPDLSLAADLAALHDEHRFRCTRRFEIAPGPCSIVDGRPVIVFGSNNYLGLATHPRVVGAAVEAARSWGAGSSGARLTTGSLALHEDLERDLAAFKHTGDAVVFSSGYAAGAGTVSALMGHGDLILSDALNHASLIDGCRLSRACVRVYRHADPDHATALIADRASFRRCLILTDGVFSMDGDIAPLATLAHLARSRDAWLMVDDAHGLGVLGATGRGSIEHAGIPSAGLIQLGTLSKALGAEGGFVAGSATLVDYLRNHARSFIFSTAPAPSTIAAAAEALRVVADEPWRRDRLRENAAYLRKGLGALGLPVPFGETPIIPIIAGKSDRALALTEALLDRGIYIPAIRPPTVPEGGARLRMSVTAEHTREHLDSALAAVRECL
ncbi:MAG: 8-amino-7-oxononanoate synthase [Capsulimonadaceae bacterium]